MIINEDRIPPDFDATCNVLVDQWLERRKKFDGTDEFYALSITDNQGQTSFWGIIDTKTTPPEDYYLLVQRHLFFASECVQWEVRNYGIIDMRAIISREIGQFC